MCVRERRSFLWRKRPMGQWIKNIHKTTRRHKLKHNRRKMKSLELFNWKRCGAVYLVCLRGEKLTGELNTELCFTSWFLCLSAQRCIWLYKCLFPPGSCVFTVLFLLAQLCSVTDLTWMTRPRYNHHTIDSTHETTFKLRSAELQQSGASLLRLLWNSYSLNSF